MLIVRTGDTGPRVVLLQVLLNRQGARLVVDGIFGRYTRQAVDRARVRLFGSGGTIADPDLWMGLFDQYQLCGIDAFDIQNRHLRRQPRGRDRSDVQRRRGSGAGHHGADAAAGLAWRVAYLGAR